MTAGSNFLFLGSASFHSGHSSLSRHLKMEEWAVVTEGLMMIPDGFIDGAESDEDLTRFTFMLEIVKSINASLCGDG
eukprot:scaffold72162_cov43-Cyclotella_meneghiniana.AAC.1